MDSTESPLTAPVRWRELRVKLHPAMHDELHELARELNTSASDLTRLILRAWLRERKAVPA